MAAGAAPRIAALPGGRSELASLTPLKRLDRCAFDNVASCVRRSVWQQHAFVSTPIAEDVEWGRNVLLAGHALAFVPDAVVAHSHDRSITYEFARTRALHERLRVLFDVQTIPSVGGLLGAVASSTARHARLEFRRPAQWPRAAALAVAWPLAQYLGGRRADG